MIEISSAQEMQALGAKIGAQLKMRLKRIASAGTAPTGNPFGLQVGCHYQADTIGSRTVSGK
jgi:hypothetical protein